MRKECPECKYKTNKDILLCPDCGKMLFKISETDWTNRILESKYKVLRKIGSGGMGVVYVAVQIPLEREVAIKFLRSEFCDDSDVVRRFLREAKAAARLDHPNIVTIHDFSQTHEGILYIAMEFLEKGRDLKAEIREKSKLPLEETASILREICLALAHAHEHGVIHRDIKPENIFLQLKGERRLVKILDFGIAKIHGGKTQTMKGIVAGTPEYMSPEQLRGEPVDARSDLYSLACVLYECLTGKPPFTGNTPMEIAMMHLNATHIPVTNTCPELPEKINKFFKKALAKRPEDRFISAQEMFETFSQISEAYTAKTILMYLDSRDKTTRLDKPQSSASHSRAWIGALVVGIIGLLIALNLFVNLPVVTDVLDISEIVENREIVDIVDAETSVFPKTPSYRSEIADKLLNWLRAESYQPKSTEQTTDNFYIAEPVIMQSEIPTETSLNIFEPALPENRDVEIPQVLLLQINKEKIRTRLQKEFTEITQPVIKVEEDIFKVKKY